MRSISLKLMASAAILVSFAASAHAAYVVTIKQDGANVVADGSGTIDLAALYSLGSGSYFSYLYPGAAQIITGPVSPTGVSYDAYGYPALIGPSSFGPGFTGFATSGGGDVVGIFAQNSEIIVPTGYVSGSPLSDSSTYAGRTLASLGLTRGSYEWTWGSGPTEDSFTVEVGVPEPSTWAMLLMGFAGLASRPLASLWRKRRNPLAPRLS
jgi:PEP-CTERM motif